MIGSGRAGGGAEGRRLALFAYGFRPFFLAAGVSGAAALLAWVGLFSGALPLPLAWPAMLWHGHEMVFGFAAAGLAGFMLTAVPNWTGAAPLRGPRLALLALLWLAGRLAMWGGALLPGALVAALDLAFLPALALFLAGSLIAQIRSTGPRNLVFLAILAVFWSGDLLTHLDALDLVPGIGLAGLHLGVDSLLVAITVVGGRIIPSFTANALRQAGITPLPRSLPALEAAAIAASLAFLLADLLAGDGAILGAVALAAALVHGARLRLWRPLATRRNPLLWVLPLGYAWMVLGFALVGLADLTGLLPASAALHALTAGAIGTMLLAVMSRAALGHTGRALVAPLPVVLAYGVLGLATALRIAAPLTGAADLPLLVAAGLLWSGAMALFAATYAPILLRPRPDGRPG